MSGPVVWRLDATGKTFRNFLEIFFKIWVFSKIMSVVRLTDHIMCTHYVRNLYRFNKYYASLHYSRPLKSRWSTSSIDTIAANFNISFSNATGLFPFRCIGPVTESQWFHRPPFARRFISKTTETRFARAIYDSARYNALTINRWVTYPHRVARGAFALVDRLYAFQIMRAVYIHRYTDINRP